MWGVGLKAVERLKFSWVIDNVLAGHEAPCTEKDLDFLKERGVQALVRMTEIHKTIVSSAQITDIGFEDCHVPVPVFTAPTPGQIVRMVDFIRESITRGNRVGVSCAAGHGRTGTILACYLVSQNTPAEQAIQSVRNMRPGSIETLEQEEAIISYARTLSER